MRKPTVIGQSSGGGSSDPQRHLAQTAPAATPLANATPTLALNALANFPVALTEMEVGEIQQRLAASDIAAMTSMDIAMLESEPERGLNAVLDQFLVRIGRFDNPRLYTLFGELNRKVAEQNLPALAERIMNDEPSLAERAKTIFLTDKGRKQAALKAWEDTKRLVTGKAKTLVDHIRDMEKELGTAQQTLQGEIQSLESLTEAYKTQFRVFAVSTAYTQQFLAYARQRVAQREAEIDPQDPVQQAELQELKDKLQALESRALALEGTLTRLPADQLVIRQLRSAAIATLQETSTTSMARFASIKMTLITLHGALTTQGVQKLAKEGADLDANLQAVRSTVMKQTVTTAANAPGDNRVEQANQIKKIIADTQELSEIVETARTSNAQKFGEAREMFDQARKAMVAIRPHT